MRISKQCLRHIPALATLAGLMMIAGCHSVEQDWSIGIYRGTSPFELAPTPANPILTAEDLAPLDALFLADPFLLRHDGRLFLLFEVWRTGSGQGDIAWAEQGPTGEWRFGGVALDEPFHLSYPFVIEHEGEVWLIPETRALREVRLYAARRFPGPFELRKVLVSGKRYADSSLVDWQGHSYLFTSPDNGTLELFVANTLGGDYHPHPASPIVTRNPCAARPGGRPIVWQDHVIRFAQCDAPVYGTSVRAFEITQLSPTRYSEHPVGLDPLLAGRGGGWNAGGMHHVDPLPEGGGLLAAVDGWRRK